jgi:hypothetical protein
MASMQAIEFQAKIRNGTIRIPSKYRQHLREEARVIVLLDQEDEVEIAPKRFTAASLRQSGLVGIWEDRDDISDSLLFARQLREKASHRR